MICLTNEGAVLLWQDILGLASIGYPNVHLFGTAHVPAHTDTESTYAAIELPGGIGYAPIALTNPGVDWTLTPIGAGAQAAYLLLTWTLTGAASIYGYWLSDQTNTYSLWAEEFATPFIYGSGGGAFNLQLVPWMASAPDSGGIPCTSP